MKKIGYLIMFTAFILACGTGDSDTPETGTPNEMNDGVPSDQSDGATPERDDVPTVTSEPAYSVLKDGDITYAEGLVHSETSTTPFSSSELGEETPLKLDVYYPDTDSANRPVFMFIHGGGFTGGLKDGPEMIEMANYYASRGWVFASVDYRTTEELCDSEEMPTCRDKLMDIGQNGPDGLYSFYQGLAPIEWMEYLIAQGPESIKQLQQGIAQYAAQRDAKAALRWIVANASTYGINTDYITVGGNSAGAVTTVALGISNLEDFRDEISADEDPTLATTNLTATYDVKSMVYFWGSNAKLDLFEAVYGLEQYERYDANDPELFMGHGQAEDLQTPYEGALELQEIYDSLGLYSELQTIVLPDGSPAGHGAWNGQVDGKGLFELSFEFLVERQNLELQ